MKKLTLILVTIALFANIGCSGDKYTDVREYEVYLSNNDSEAVHMWITGKQIGPDNKLQPGEGTTYIYWKSAELMAGEVDEDIITIYAGRNGSVLTSITQTVDRRNAKKAFAYDGSRIR